MPKFHVDVPHSLPQAEATERLNRFVEAIGDKFGDQVSDMEQSWEENRLNFGFKTFGIALKGEVTVADDKLLVDGELPFAAMMFKGKIESSIKEQLERLMRS